MTWGELEALIDDREAQQPSKWLSRNELDELHRIGTEAIERENKERMTHGG